MKPIRLSVFCLVAAMMFVFLAGPAMAKSDSITVAYFPGWPGTFEYGWSKGWFDKEMGVKVKFREFGALPMRWERHPLPSPSPRACR